MKSGLQSLQKKKESW